MKKTLIAAGFWLFIATAGFGQARFVYGTGVGRSFEEASYRSVGLEEALLSYTIEKFKVVASILYSGYNNTGRFETFMVRDPSWAFSSNIVPVFFMELKGRLDTRYTDLVKNSGYGGMVSVLYIRRKVSGEEDAGINTEFIIDAIRFPFTPVQ
ncbi:MAG: hypothetical protein LBI91_08370 [Spirochaetaceae bacterium]|jgi:hypothetical protein|nr:hypothetical protein [Spirochaetaceae bacterium]